MTVRVVGPKSQVYSGHEYAILDVTSRARNWAAGLSPFFLGPVTCYAGLVAQNVENAWQYSKVYDFQEPDSLAWRAWRDTGFAQRRAARYPAGRGARIQGVYWDGRLLDMQTARREVYIPIYARAAYKTLAYQQLKSLYAQAGKVTLWDFDGYDHHAAGLTYDEIINARRPMGHAFVLAMMLEGALP